jgi:3-oxoacyl-[acyl-carrier protein] reductase
MKLLLGKNVIITGASRGIGKGIAELFAKHGANIAFTYHSSDEKAKLLETELSVNGCKAKGYKSDASDFEAAQQLVKDVMEDFGSIDVLVNNAGITKDGLLMRMSEEDFDSVMNNNMKSVFNMTKAVATPMLKAKSGSIINRKCRSS